MIKQSDRTAADLDLFALMVARLLHERGCERPPARSDYAVLADDHFAGGRLNLHVRVDLGRGLRVQVQGHWITDGRNGLERLIELADEIADAVEATMESAIEQRGVLCEVGAAARREAAKARRRGLTWHVVSVEPSPVPAGRFEGPAATLTMQVVGATPRPAFETFDAYGAEDVVAELDCLREEQTRLAQAWRAHALRGATGAIDPVVHAELVASGEDVSAILRRLAAAEHWITDLDRPGGDRNTLYWKDGAVKGQILLGDGVSWSEGALTFRAAPDWFGERVAGRDVGALTGSPLLAGVTVRRTSGEPGGHGTAWCDAPALLFDATSGRVWVDEPMALAA